MDHDYKIINFFEKWIGYIVNEGYDHMQDQEDDQGNIVPVSDPSADNYFYRVNFPKLYQTSIYIKKFEKDYSRFLEYKFLKAYPISINTMSVTYNASQVLKCTVNFNFSRYLTNTGFIVPDDDHYVPFNDGLDVNGLPLDFTSFAGVDLSSDGIN